MAVALDAETEIIATLASKDACATYYREGLGESHFADQNCRAVFSWAMEYYATHGRMEQAPSMDVIETEFPAYRELIADVKGAAPSYLAKRLKGEYIKRQVNDTVKTFLPMINDDAMGVAIMMREAFSGIVDNCVTTDEILEYGKDMDAYRRKLAEVRMHSGAPYPFKEMQAHTGGIHDGELAVLVGPSGMGKSLFACKTALEAIRAGHSVFFATLELTIETITQRMEFMVANEDGLKVPIVEYTSGRVLPEYELHIRSAQDKIAAMDGRLVVSQPQVEDRTPTALVQACKAHGCDFLIVDQLQFVKRPRRDTIQESYGAALQEFKQQIMTPVDNRRIPLLLLHQMNRSGAKEQRSGAGKVGTMENIAGSAWVEQISDIVWGIGRNDEERNNDIMNLATLKTRNVAPIGWQLSWDPNVTYQFDILRDEGGNARRLDNW